MEPWGRVDRHHGSPAGVRMDKSKIRRELWQYLPLIDMLGETLGEDVEIVLHDLKQPDTSVVYAVNTRVTGRQVGQSFNYLIDHVLLSDRFNGDYLANYKFLTPDKRVIRSSSVFLKDAEGKTTGAICLNCDTTAAGNAVAFLQRFLHFPDDQLETPAPPSQPHVEEMVEDMIDHIIATGMPTQDMSRKERVAVISRMEQQGVFLAKGAVDKVAERLGVAVPTVYSYLDDVRKEAPGDN